MIAINYTKEFRVNKLAMQAAPIDTTPEFVKQLKNIN